MQNISVTESMNTFVVIFFVVSTLFSLLFCTRSPTLSSSNLYESTTGNHLNNPLILSICCSLTGLSLIRAGMLEGPWGGLAQRFGTEQGGVLEQRSVGEGAGGVLYTVEVFGLEVV